MGNGAIAPRPRALPARAPPGIEVGEKSERRRLGREMAGRLGEVVGAGEGYYPHRPYTPGSPPPHLPENVELLPTRGSCFEAAPQQLPGWVASPHFLVYTGGRVEVLGYGGGIILTILRYRGVGYCGIGESGIVSLPHRSNLQGSNRNTIPGASRDLVGSTIGFLVLG